MEHTTLTLGSLFDGSGGFPLGGQLAGITPVWASEVEPFPIRVTTRRFPGMRHYGDVSQMDGGKIEPVDIITFGSPCTDMSIAGKRAGLDGAQSSLFYQAIRIIKEMRCATNGQYPRWICWENVPGAFSSHEGRDFKAVLESIIGIVEPGAEVPPPEKGKWPKADCYLGDGWSLAYRTLDAQHWGVPQRRRRIYLVANFAGECAGRVLFESEGLSGYSPQSFQEWQSSSRYPSSGPGAAGDLCLNDQGGARMDITSGMVSTLRAESHHPPCVMQGFPLEHNPSDSRLKLIPENVSQTLTHRMGTGGNNVPLVLKIRAGCAGGGKGPLIQENKSATLSCNNEQTLFVPDHCGTSNSAMPPESQVYSISQCSRPQVTEEQAPTLMARDYKDPTAVSCGYHVRRLTPTECARLQGFPDWWCSDLCTQAPSESDIDFWSEVWETHCKILGKSSRPKTRSQIIKWLKAPHSDSAEYKMWGNGVALPCVLFVLSGIVWSTQMGGQ